MFVEDDHSVLPSCSYGKFCGILARIILLQSKLWNKFITTTKLTMRIKEKLSDFASVIFAVLIIGIWITGAIHGTKKHDASPFSSNFYSCWYYGVEAMWHKTNFKDLNDNIRVITMFMVQNPNEMATKDLLEHNESKKEIKKILDKYDNTETAYMKAGVNSFISLSASLQNDIVDGMVLYNNTGIFEFKLSEKTKKINKECSQYGLEDDVQKGIQFVEDSFKAKATNEVASVNGKLFDETAFREKTTRKNKELETIAKDLFSE